ncbi:hypothetical protein GCM10009762_27890 [Dermacoccus barathri]|uniref:Uncharacterized protein n=1 Tax=Dermacoccus barathri TaxID=322601 RepID=A0ABN2C6J0_9MICO
MTERDGAAVGAHDPHAENEFPEATPEREGLDHRRQEHEGGHEDDDAPPCSDRIRGGADQLQRGPVEAEEGHRPHDEVDDHAENAHAYAGRGQVESDRLTGDLRRAGEIPQRAQFPIVDVCHANRLLAAAGA